MNAILVIGGILLAIGFFIVQSRKSSKAEALYREGRLDEALLEYKQVFLRAFTFAIDKDGDGHAPSFVAVLRKQRKTSLEKITDIIAAKGQRLDLTPIDALLDDAERFLEQKGVMNFKKQPVGDGKPVFAEFHRRLNSFADTIRCDNR